VECVDVAVARQRHDKHVSKLMDMHAAIEELLEVGKWGSGVFYVVHAKVI
jgi:hypothetical protein